MARLLRLVPRSDKGSDKRWRCFSEFGSPLCIGDVIEAAAPFHAVCYRRAVFAVAWQTRLLDAVVMAVQPVALCRPHCRCGIPAPNWYCLRGSIVSDDDSRCSLEG